jgi:hypothetical protein
MPNQNLRASVNYAICTKENESGKILLTPAYFNKYYERISDVSSRASKKCEIRNAVLLTPAYFSCHHHLHVSDSDGESREDFYLLPKIIKPCKKCENARYIKGNTIIQTSCYCSEILPENYLRYTPTIDDIYSKMSAPESDLPW